MQLKKLWRIYWFRLKYLSNAELAVKVSREFGGRSFDLLLGHDTHPPKQFVSFFVCLLFVCCCCLLKICLTLSVGSLLPNSHWHDFLTAVCKINRVILILPFFSSRSIHLIMILRGAFKMNKIGASTCYYTFNTFSIATSRYFTCFREKKRMYFLSSCLIKKTHISKSDLQRDRPTPFFYITEMLFIVLECREDKLWVNDEIDRVCFVDKDQV